MFYCSGYRVHNIYTDSQLTSSANQITTVPKVIKAEQMWNKYTGKDVVVAVIDTGIDTNHPVFGDSIIGGSSFVPGLNSFDDDHGHGTHVAGIVHQVAPAAKLLVIKVLDKNGVCDNDALIDALRYAISWRGPRGESVSIINMSLGSPQSYTPLRDAVVYAAHCNKIIFAAAGNEGDGNSTTVEVGYPAMYSEAISIGAVDFTAKVARFSNSNKEVDMAAPGDNILSAWPGGRYAALSGTSMATPAAAGLAALYVEKYRVRFGKEPVAKEVNIIMKALTRDIDEVGIDANTGAGLIQGWL